MTINQAWEILFRELKILNSLDKNPIFPITATQINTIGRKEARLMAKFDTAASLPDLFKEHQLNINATSNGNYILFKDEGKSFITLPDYKKIVPEKFNPSLDFALETLTFSPRMSESNAIDFAHHCGLLSTYTNDHNLKLTTRGRFFSKEFSFALGKLGRIPVKSVQIEVDAGYESENQFLILEGKSSTRETFNVRQLYYPYRHFQNRTNKQIRTTLLSFSNGIYFFTELGFSDNYYDYAILNTSAFEVVIEETANDVTIDDLMSQATYTPENIPVPQADDLNKVIDTLALLSETPLNKHQISNTFEFDERQGDYYSNAVAYIGLAKKNGRLFELTDKGRTLLNITNRRKRNQRLVSAILSTTIFNDLYKQWKSNNGTLPLEIIIDRIMQEGYNYTTAHRRTGTIYSWFKWINENF